MKRRAALRTGLALFSGTSLAGCLDVPESLDSESAWRDLVIDRPDEIYVPPKVDGMVVWGTAEADGYAISLSATRPHRFWTITGRETNQIAMRDAHSVHLMASLWSSETDRFVPADVRVSIHRGGDRVIDRTLWPMLSQRMGIHYGDNVALPTSGSYRATVRVIPHGTDRPDEEAFEPMALDVEFEYEPAEIEALDLTILEESRRGRPGAVEAMGQDHHDHEGVDRDEHGDHAGTHGHPPVPTAPPAATFPDVLADELRGDYRLVVAKTEREFGEYLLVSPRTRYNEFPLPFSSFAVSVDRGPSGTKAHSLTEVTHPTLGHHYRVVVDSLPSGATITIALETPPQVARHEGYETAFFELSDLSLRVP